MHLILRLILLIVAIAAAPAAMAACTLAGSNSAPFGSASSYTVRAGQVASISGPVSLSCNGSIVSLLSGNYARANVTSANGFKLSAGGSDRIAYRISAAPAGAYTFTQGGTIDYFDASLLSLLNILNAAAFQPPMYLAVTDMPNVAAGTYSDIVTINWSWSVCRGVGVGGACVLADVGSGQTMMTVSVIVTNDCRISAPPVSFGSAPFATQFSPVAQAALVECTKGSSFSVAFTSGNSGASRPWRAMSDGAGHSLQYNIYLADGATIWDQSNPQPGGTGSGETTPSIAQNYVAKINPAQASPVAGVYSDTVSIVVTF